MVYIIFGPPQTAYCQSDIETWTYWEQDNRISLTFDFIKAVNPFSDKVFILQRKTEFKSSWYIAVYYWRRWRGRESEVVWWVTGETVGWWNLGEGDSCTMWDDVWVVIEIYILYWSGNKITPLNNSSYIYKNFKKWNSNLKSWLYGKRPWIWVKESMN